MNETARDDVYDLTSVLYHALQSVETAERFRRDAQSSSDAGLLAFFDEVRQVNLRLAEEAKEHLRTQLVQEAADPGGRAARPLPHNSKVDEASRESFPASDAPAY